MVDGCGKHLSGISTTIVHDITQYIQITTWIENYVLLTFLPVIFVQVCQELYSHQHFQEYHLRKNTEQYTHYSTSPIK